MPQQNPNRAKVSDMVRELVELISPFQQFLGRTWAIYDLEDLDEKRQFQGFPVVGVAYEGARVADQSENNTASRMAACQAAAYMEFRFSVIVGIEYNPTGQEDGTAGNMDAATDLLDAIREAILGYKGVNTRPWQLEGEAPTGSEIEGVIWYGQVWKTSVPVLSQHR